MAASAVSATGGLWLAAFVQTRPGERLHDRDARLCGFSHTSLGGAGIPDHADVPLMPATALMR